MAEKAQSGCLNCGEENFELEMNGNVCTNCGVVTEEVQFGTEFCAYAVTKTKYKFKGWFGKRKGKPGVDTPVSKAKSNVEFLCRSYNVSGSEKEEVLQLVGKVFAGGYPTRKWDPAAAAGSCFIHVRRRYHNPISISVISKKLTCSMSKIFQYSKLIMQINSTQSHEDSSDDDVPPVSLQSQETVKCLVTNFLGNFPDDSKHQLIAKTASLVQLAVSCWVAGGRSPESLICGAACLCWKSMDISRRTLATSDFCKKFNLSLTKARKSVLYLKDLIIKLGSKVPSFVKNYVNEKNYLYHLDYILENSESLRNDLLQDEFTSQGTDCKEYEAFRGPLDTSIPEPQDDTLDINASDVEISDSEISSYIKTDDQIKFEAGLRKSRPLRKATTPVDET